MKLTQIQDLTTSQELAETLRSAIRSGEFSIGERLPSERVLSEQSGLSRMTVRRAIQKLEDEGLLYRITGSGTYVGQGNAASNVHALGLLVPTFANSFFGELSDVVEREAQKHGYGLLVGRSDFDAASEASYLQRYADNPNVKGVLVVPGSHNTPHTAYEYLIRQNTPFVFVVRPDGQAQQATFEVDSVMIDHQRGAYQIVRYLIEQGHRQIAYIGSSTPKVDTHREGYQQALREAGIRENARLVVSIDGDAEQAGREGVRTLLERGVPFTAVFARIDDTAIAAIRTLQEAGLRVPEDISVAGFDNVQLSQHIQPPLTTVDHTLSEIGRLAIWMLLDRAEGGYNGPSRRILLSPRLTLRASCTPPKGSS